MKKKCIEQQANETNKQTKHINKQRTNGEKKKGWEGETGGNKVNKTQTKTNKNKQKQLPTLKQTKKKKKKKKKLFHDINKKNINK